MWPSVPSHVRTCVRWAPRCPCTGAQCTQDWPVSCVCVWFCSLSCHVFIASHFSCVVTWTWHSLKDLIVHTKSPVSRRPGWHIFLARCRLLLSCLLCLAPLSVFLPPVVTERAYALPSDYLGSRFCPRRVTLSRWISPSGSVFSSEQ